MFLVRLLNGIAEAAARAFWRWSDRRRRWWERSDRRRRRWERKQRPIEFNFFGYPLLVPSGHPIPEFFTQQNQGYQPYREMGLVNIVRSLQQQRRSGTVVDIGANVGDSCAIVHRYSTLKIVAVEASDFFFRYLTRNVESLFSDRAIAKQAFVVSTPDESPTGLFHGRGSARAIDAPFTERCEAVAITGLLSSVGEVALLKVDVDGLDVDLISSVFDGADVAAYQPPRFPIYFEYEFPGDCLEKVRAHCAKLLLLFEKVVAAGYETAFIWDAHGRFYGLVDLRNTLNITNAVNYMGHFRHRPISGYDICLVHRSDSLFASELCKIISRDAVIPVNVIAAPARCPALAPAEIVGG